MQDKTLLLDLLKADTEDAVVQALEDRGLFEDKSRWYPLGGMPNNQSIVHAQQSTPAAALIEKYTNGVDAILMRHCKGMGIDPRGPNAPASMAAAIDQFLGKKVENFAKANASGADREILRKYAEENLLLYATGTKERPSLSFYDAGEGQLPGDFPSTFCSLIHGVGGGSYKGAIPFVQGRFNMGSSGVLPFCSEKHKLQLVVSRVPKDIAGGDEHEWGFTLMCYFPSKRDPSWSYLVGPDGHVMTAGRDPIGMLPKAGVKSGELNSPREREVVSGTLVKMYDFKAPRSNICGELFKKLEEFLLRPPLPLRIIECREGYMAKVMRVTVWDRLGVWAKDKLEPGFEDGASVSIQLSTGEVVPAEIRVFKPVRKEGQKGFEDFDSQQTGLRALVNGQSHAKRDAHFFRTKAVDKEHIAGSMLVILDCTDLGSSSRNAIFMSNRETFREDPLLTELLRKLQKELNQHEGLIEVNNRRYEEKVKDAVDDEDGLKALEELLGTDPELAELFGSTVAGAVAAKMADFGTEKKVEGKSAPFKGSEFPSYFKKADGNVSANIEIPRGESGRTSFLTDVRNDYFSRKKDRGTCSASGDVTPSTRLFNGRLTLTFSPDKALPEGTKLTSSVEITDSKGHGPFQLSICATIVKPLEKKPPKPPRPPLEPKVPAGPSRPEIKEVHEGEDAPPLTVISAPGTDRLKILLNVDSKLLIQARAMKQPEDEAAVDFVFKYGLALTAFGLIDTLKKGGKWDEDQAKCQEEIRDTATGIARVIVPLCLSLPKKLPKSG